MLRTKVQLKPWVKLVLAISLDGRISSPLEKGAAYLGGPGDRRVLEEALTWADGTLMGSNTLRAHQTTCLIKDHDLIERRLKEGRCEQPISIVVSKNKNHSLAWPVFSQPIKRWLLRPREARSQEGIASEAPTGYECEVIMENKWVDTLQKLKELGLSRIVLLGGSKLAGSLLEADQVDELQLTLIPRILGGENCWVSTSINKIPEQMTMPEAWMLKNNKVLEGNELLLSYFRNRSVK